MRRRRPRSRPERLGLDGRPSRDTRTRVDEEKKRRLNLTQLGRGKRNSTPRTHTLVHPRRWEHRKSDDASFRGTPTPTVATPSMVKTHEVSPKVSVREPKAEEYPSSGTHSCRCGFVKGGSEEQPKHGSPQPAWDAPQAVGTRRSTGGGRRTGRAKNPCHGPCMFWKSGVRSAVVVVTHVVRGWEQTTPAGLAPATKPDGTNRCRGPQIA